ncbi:serine/threonine-protein kinase [Nocardia thailandica]
MPSRTLPPGTIFAGYRIERVLGSGGMGTVYVAAHPRLPRRDALKVLSAEYGADPEFRARFIREAELAARLDHPEIVGVYDRGVTDGRLWIAMRFVDGPDAATVIRTAPPSPERALHIVAAVARGLDHAHRAGLLHRDVKPANILLEPVPGRPDRVALTDFGIAKAVAATTALTQAGSVLATVAYAAPEQLSGGPVDHRADVYALGCTLYELLTGAKPFPRATPEAVIAAHLHEPPPRPTALVRDLPRAIDAVVARAMAKDPGDRYPDCGALAAAAALAFDGQGAAAGSPAPRRRRIRLGLAAVVATGLLVAGAVLYDRDAAPAAGGQPAATGPADPNAWAAHQWLVDLFPALLPRDQAAAGYQNLRCLPVDGSQQPIDATETRDALNALACNGDQSPVYRLVVRCGLGEPVVRFAPSEGAREVGQEDWQKPSGKGRISWYDAVTVHGAAGELLLRFDDPARANCTLGVTGGTSGGQLYDTWWRDAPV